MPKRLARCASAPVQSAFGGGHWRGSPTPLLYVLSKTMIRHTKKQNLGGQEVLQLPPKTETAVPGAAPATRACGVRGTGLAWLQPGSCRDAWPARGRLGQS